MPHIRIVTVGSIKETFFANAILEYLKRLTKYCKTEIIEIRENTPTKECQNIIEKLLGYNILFDISGTMVSSQELSTKISKITQTQSTITFIIGASDGIDPAILPHIQERISFGKITLPHQLFRVVALEQIYRAFTILNNEKYHK